MKIEFSHGNSLTEATHGGFASLNKLPQKLPHMNSHEHFQCNTERKIEVYEISARKLHLSAVILGLVVKLFLNKYIGFHYSSENFNDYLPFKCFMV